MVDIKISMKVVIVSIIITIFMYPKTIEFLITSGENICVANKLNTAVLQSNKVAVDSDKTRVVFMFDDGWKSVYTEAYGIIAKYGYTASVSIIPSLVDEKEYISYKNLSEIYLEGWDLLNHSYSHKENTYDNTNELLSNFNKARKWMNNRYIGNCSDMLVLPYGEINPYLIYQLKGAGYRNVRTSENIIVLDESKIEYYPVTVINLLTDVSVNEVEDLLAQTFDKSKTVIIILHKIGDQDNGYGMTYSKDKLEEIIAFINGHSEEFAVVNYSQLFD